MGCSGMENTQTKGLYGAGVAGAVRVVNSRYVSHGSHVNCMMARLYYPDYLSHDIRCVPIRDAYRVFFNHQQAQDCSRNSLRTFVSRMMTTGEPRNIDTWVVWCVLHSNREAFLQHTPSGDDALRTWCKTRVYVECSA